MNGLDQEITREVGRIGLNVSPGLSATGYAIVSGGLPIIAGLLTVVLLTLQIMLAVRKLKKPDLA